MGPIKAEWDISIIPFDGGHECFWRAILFHMS